MERLNPQQMENVKKANKDYLCDTCGNKIAKGSKYILIEQKHPKYAECKHDPTEDGEQIGVDYSKFRMHLLDEYCMMDEECRKGNHQMESYFDADPNSPYCGTTYEWCEKCLYSLEEIKKYERSKNVSH